MSKVSVSIAKSSVFLYFILFILFIEFSPMLEIPWLDANIIFGGILDLLTGDREVVREVMSDSYYMNVLLILFALTAILISLIFRRSIYRKFSDPRISNFLYHLLSAYLCLVLFQYGFNKIFLKQFVFPAENILYSRVGDLSKDILFWSSMGSSKLYQITTGSIEVIVGVLVFLRRTRFLGLLLATLTFAHIFLLNISFDISVKLFSLNMIILSLFLLSKYHQKIVQLLTFDVSRDLKRNALNTLIVIGLLTISMLPYIMSQDEQMEKELLEAISGAYHVVDMNDESVETVFEIFIHPDGYIIFRNDQNIAFDYQLEFSAEESKFLFTNGSKSIVYLELLDKGLLAINDLENGDYLTAKKVDSENMELTKDSFNWTVDSFYLKNLANN